MGKFYLDVYCKVIKVLDVSLVLIWMVGDNYEWEVVVFKSNGIFLIWYNLVGLEIFVDVFYDLDYYV